MKRNFKASFEVLLCYCFRQSGFVCFWEDVHNIRTQLIGGLKSISTNVELNVQ